MTTQTPQPFSDSQSIALDAVKSNFDAVTKLTSGPLNADILIRIANLSLDGLRIARPPRAPAFGIGLDQGLDPAYVVRQTRHRRAIFEAVYETLAPIRSRFIENLEHQTGVRGLRWRIEAGAALLYPTRTLAVVVWSPERIRSGAIVCDEERRELHRPIELLIKRTLQGGV